MDKTFDVVVIGNAGIDTNIYSEKEIDFSFESNFTTNVDYVGQAGGYTARGYAQLGYRTAFIGYVGEDHNGRLIIEEFNKDGIDTDAVFIDPAGTARSINFMFNDGRRKNFYDGKSHTELNPDLIKCEEIIRRAKFAHFHIPDWARQLLPAARKHNVKIACDLQDVADINDEYRRDFIEQSDILFFSNVNHAAPDNIINELLSADNKKIVIAGMGKEGCALGTSKGIKKFSSVELEEPVIDTNGAGDGLAVGFLSSYLIENNNLSDSILKGQITARYTCTQKASSSNLINKNQLQKFFEGLV